MKSRFALPLAFGLAVASPTRANVGECIARHSNGPMVTNPNTPEHFQNYPDFNQAALAHNHNETSPKGYYPVPNFINLRAAAQDESYLGSIEPPSYSPDFCASVCNDMKDCWSFNICGLPSCAFLWRPSPANCAQSMSVSL